MGEPHLDNSTTLIIGFDSAGNYDKAVLTVCRYNWKSMTLVSSFIGKEAEELYSKLMSGGTIKELINRE